MFAPCLRSWFIICRDTASRMSSVFGLKARPRMAMFLSSKLLRRFLQSSIAL